MGKEVKIGIAVILILMCVLVGAMAMRLTRKSNKPAAEAVAAADTSQATPARDAKRPASLPATVLTADNGSARKQEGWATATDVSRTAPSPSLTKPPAPSFMPAAADSKPASSALLGAGPPAPPKPSAQSPGPIAGNPLRLDSPAPPSPRLPDLRFATGGSADNMPPPVGYSEGYLTRRHGHTPMGYGMQSGPYGSSSPQLPPPESAPIRTVGLADSNPAPPAERVQPGGTYKVQLGDSYWTISGRLYGTGGYFKALAEHNRDRNPREDHLQPGIVLAAPTAADLEAKYPSLCPKPNHHLPPSDRLSMTSGSGRLAGRRTYVVQAGDTLYDIAKHELGNPGRWGEIYQLNRRNLGDDYDYLAPGLELILPDTQRPDSVTGRPEGTMRR